MPARFNEGGAGKLRLLPDRRGRIYAEDQVGDPPALVEIDSWARVWQSVEWELLPAPTMPALCAWLLARLERIVANPRFPLVDFITELEVTRQRLWSEAGRAEPRPELCVGVPCRRCDLLSLWRVADGSGDVECHNPDCRTVYQPDEYRRWVALVAAAADRGGGE